MSEIELKLISDIFIDSNENILSYEYDIDLENKKILIYDFDKFLNYIYDNFEEDGLNEIFDFMEEFNKNIQKINKNKQRNEEEQTNLFFNDVFKIFKNEIQKNENDFLIKILKYKADKYKSSNVNLFFNDRLNNYIPASSIKGVLRNAIRDNFFLKIYSNDIKLDKEFYDKLNLRLDNELKDLIIRDYYFEDDNNFLISEVKTFLSNDNENNKSFSSLELYEILRKNSDVNIKVENFKLEWIYFVNKFSQNVINLQIKFLENKIINLKNPKTKNKINYNKIEMFENVLYFFQNLLYKFNDLNDNECIMSLGKNTGWLSKEIPSFYIKKYNLNLNKIKDFKNIKNFDLGMKSLSLDSKNNPFGWVKIILKNG